MSVRPAGVQLDVSHAHAQRQKTVHVSRLRQRLLPELRSEEAFAETPRRPVPAAAAIAVRADRGRVLGSPAAVARRAAVTTARPRRRAVPELGSARNRAPVRSAETVNALSASAAT